MLDQLPRGPIFNQDGEAPDHTDGYMSRMLSWENSAQEEALATAKLSDDFSRVGTYINYVKGQHWDARRPPYRSKFYINKTGKARIDSLALLTDSRPAIEIYSKIPEYSSQGEAVDAVIRHEWLNGDMDLSLVTATDIAGAQGTAFWKIGAAFPGMMRVVPCGMDNVMPIQPGFHIQQSTAVLYRTWKSLAEVMHKFPARAADLEKESARTFVAAGLAYQRPDNVDQWTWNGLAPQMKRMLGRQVPTEELQTPGPFRAVEWKEYYIEDYSRNQSNRSIVMRDPYMSPNEHNWWYEVRPGERLYPRKRLVIFAGRTLIYDGPAPYWHGLYPFACLRLNPVFWSFWGLSKYRDMIPVNSAINEIIAGVLDMIKRALNPTVVGKNSIPKAAWAQFFPDMPGAKLYLPALGNPQQDIRYMDPPNIPAYVFQILGQFLGPEFDKLSGIMDIAALSKKMQVPGGDTIEQMRDNAQTPLRFEGRMIESFLKDAGLQAVSHVFQFYRMKQLLRVAGPDGISIHNFDFNPDMLTPANEDRFSHWQMFPVSVVPGSLHGGAKDRSKMMFMTLFKMGAIGPKRLLEELEIKNVDEAIKEAVEFRAAMAGGAGMPGGDTPRLTRGARNGQPF